MLNFDPINSKQKAGQTFTVNVQLSSQQQMHSFGARGSEDIGRHRRGRRRALTQQGAQRGPRDGCSSRNH